MTYLDTHVLVSLFAGDLDKIGANALEAIEAGEIVVSPMAVLELEFLHEIGRLRMRSAELIEELGRAIGLRVCKLPFRTVVERAIDEKWIRDPFDRIIVAHARANDAPLVTRDQRIHRHYARAVW